MDEGLQRLLHSARVRPDIDAPVAAIVNRARHRRARQRLVVGLSITTVLLVSVGAMASLPGQRVDLAPAGEREATPVPTPTLAPTPTPDDGLAPTPVACQEGAQPLPGDAAHVHEHAADLDGDGRDEQLSVYVSDGQVHVHVRFASGGSHQIPVTDALDNGVADIVGIADVNGDGIKDLWLNVGAATGQRFGLVTIDGCVLREVADGHGAPLRLWQAATADLSLESWFTCPTAGHLVEYSWEAVREPDVTWDPNAQGHLTQRTYRVDGHTAHLVDEQQEPVARPDLPRDADDCGSWDMDVPTPSP